MKIGRIVLLLLVAGCLGWLGYTLANYKKNAAKVRPIETPPVAVVETTFSLEDSDDVKWIDAETIAKLLSSSAFDRRDTIKLIEDNWKPGYVALLVEMFFTAGVQYPPLGEELIRVLEEKTGAKIGFDTEKWMMFAWNHDLKLPPDYAEFKKRLYEKTDQRFTEYFDNNPVSEIRLDEIVWGGVVKDGIPPLRAPAMIDAEAAFYLADTDVVFGVEINGDARAYPKRILAHHEMFTDAIGGVSVCGVY